MNPDPLILTPKEEALENELLSYSPRVPSLDLKARIRVAAAELGVTPSAAPSSPEITPLAKLKVVRFPFTQALISAAALIVAGVFGFAIWQQNQSPSGAGGSLVKRETPNPAVTGSSPNELLLFDRAPRVDEVAPTHRERVLVGQHNDGVVSGEDGQPMWKLRYKFLNRAVWEDPETGEQHKMEVPEEREVLVPVHHD